MTQEIAKKENQELGTACSQDEACGCTVSPDVDIYENPEGLVVAVDLPGVAKEGVKLEIDEADILSIRGTRRDTESGEVVVRQFVREDYHRTFSLSDAFDKEKITAKLEDGVLEIRIPRKEALKPKRIEVKL